MRTHKGYSPIVSEAKCEDCERPYGDNYGFPDLIIPNWAWRKISSTGDTSGLLCPSCICSRLNNQNITCPGSFMSGPIESQTREVMQLIRQVENIEER